jgi:hypothetical protein
MVRLFAITLVTLTIQGFTLAQGVKFSASVSSNVVTTDDRIRLEFTSNQRGKIKYPDLRDFDIVGGPYQGSSSNISIINGRMESSQTVTFTLDIRAKKTGNLVIGPATYSVDGKSYTSNSITVQVSKGQQQPTTSGGASGANLDPNQQLTASMSVSRTNLYKGESVVVTYKVYSRFQFYQLTDFKPGTQTGFFTKEIDLNLRNNTYDVQQEMVNGVPYYAIVLRKELLIAQQSGDLTLAPFEVEMALVNGRGFFANTFGARAKSNPVTLKVKPLPSPPDDFTGMVGSLGLKAAASRTEMKADEGFDYVVELSGNGNLQFMDPPKLDLPDEFEIYDPEEESSVQTTAAGMSGTRKFRYFIIPRIHGDMEVVPVSISYFDPASGTYKSLKSEPLNLKIERSANSVAAGAQGSGSKKVKMEEKNEMRYLETGDDLRTPGNPFASIWFAAGTAVPPVALALLFLLAKRRSRPVAEADLRKRSARKELVAARKAMAENNTAAFFESVHMALTQFLLAKTHLDLSRLSKDNAREALQKRGASPDVVNRLIQTLETCEMARYGMQTTQPEALLADSEMLFNDLEKELK